MTVDLLLPQLDIMVANAAQAGMYVLISDFSGNQIDETDWNLNSQLWAAVAPRYANNTNVIYEIKNEGNYTESMGVYAGHMQAAYLQIRAAAPNTPILVWSCAGGPCADTGVVAEAPQINYSNAVIAFHGYAPGYDYDGYVSQMNAAGYPVMMDEVNDNSNASYSSGWSLIMDMQNIGVSWGWLDGDGFCNAADNVAYGNCVTYINVTWPED